MCAYAGRVVAAVDLGGTKIQTLLFDEHLAILARDRCASAPHLGAEAMITAITDSITATLDNTGGQANLLAIGIAAAGTINPSTGSADSVNLANWRDLALVGPLQTHFGCRVQLENDGTAAALGEFTHGAGLGATNLIHMALGTGVGGGLVLDGRLYRGISGAAGELGHIPLDPLGPLCGCGSRGCLEQYASGTAIARAGTDLVASGGSPILSAMAAGRPVTTEMIHQAALAGDAGASAVIATAGRWLGRGLVALVNVFNPDLIVIGGGVANLGNLLLDPARQEIAANAMRPAGPAVTIRTSTLGDTAAPLGVAALLLG